jgi:hypothetical protein
MKRNFVLGLLMLAACLYFTAGTAQAVELFDGDVVVHGKISEQLLMRAHDTRDWELYDYNVFNARSTLKLETMYHAFKGPEYQVNFYGVWKQFYDAADHIDGNYRRYLEWAAQGTDKAVNEERSYSSFRDICRELYGELNGPMFQVRLGKQIVSWGETGFERMVDQINPIDQRGNLNPAYPDFAEIKQGLWMGRFFFTPPDQPMDLTYELLVIPDFQPTILNPVGYHNTHPRAFNSLKNPNEMYEAYYRDAPDGSFSKPEWGGRIRGFLAGYDWTLSYFNHRVDDGVLGPDRALKQGIGPALGSTRFTRNADLRFMHLNNLYPLSNVYRYPWQQDVGFTVNKPVDVRIPIIPGTDLAMTGNIARMEALWEHNKPALHAEALAGLKSDITRQDRYAVCVSWATKIFMPYITPYFRNKLLSSTTQLFYEKMPDKHSSDYYYPWVTYGKKRSSWTMVSQELSYEFWNGRILPGFYGAWYCTNGGGYWAPAIAFKPNFGHTFLVRYLAYSHLIDSPANVNSKDSWTFEYTYEF